MKKRIISLLLVALLMVSLVPMSAGAASNPYPTQQNVDGDGYYEVPCTWFAWQQVHDNLGIALPGWGNAQNWLNGAKNSGYATGSTPVAGSIAVWSGGTYGHVAYVASVQNSSTFTVNEGGRTDLDQTSSHGIAYGYRMTNVVGQKRPYDNNLTLIGFVYPKGYTAPTITAEWDGPKVTNITNTNAYISGTVYFSQSVNTTACGIRMFDSKNQLVKHYMEYTNYNTSYVNIFYDVTGELGVTLTPGEKYTFQFFAIASGKEYWSSNISFTTTGGHTHAYKAGVTVPSTCTTRGYTNYTCSCGDRYTKYTAALGHAYKNGVCSRCNARQQGAFVDVKAGSYCFDPVAWAVKNDITKGMTATEFWPDYTCTRGQIVTFLWRAAGKPTVSGGQEFSDVKRGSYYYDAVKWAAANGITKGITADKFMPEDTCTRAQVVTFLWRANGSPKANASVNFQDVSTGAYYYGAVRWAVRNDITNGMAPGLFMPDNGCTRGQVVTFMYRAW